MLEEFKKSADKILEDTLQRTKEIYKLPDRRVGPEDNPRHRRHRRTVEDRGRKLIVVVSGAEGMRSKTDL